MKLLEEKIRKEGRILPGDVLKIDSFLNHQIDVNFVNEMGKEIKRLFENEEVTKILTIEASGIALAFATAQNFGGIPVVFAKKSAANNMSEDKYTSRVYSYTRQQSYNIAVSCDYLKPEDKVLIVDDFLANGQASLGMLELCQRANCKVVGVAIAVSKSYQAGEKLLKEKNVHLEVLARVKHMEDGQIEFED